MNRIRYLAAVGLMLLVLAGFACSFDEIAEEGLQDRIRVVTTIYPLADIIGELGGDSVEVIYLLPAGASPHTYEPTVEQARSVAEAQLFIHIGSGLDDWASKLAETVAENLRTVTLTASIELLPAAEHAHRFEPGSLNNGGSEDDLHTCEDHRCGHNHGHYDPHIWLDPIIVRDQISPLITRELTALLPAQKEYFHQRQEAFENELTLLDREIIEAVEKFSKHDFIAFHSAWSYLAHRYGLKEIAVIAEFPGQEPSSGWIAQLIRLIEERDIGAILVEPQFSSALAERIAEESGIAVIVIDPLGGENIDGRESYLNLMRFNIEALEEALR